MRHLNAIPVGMVAAYRQHLATLRERLLPDSLLATIPPLYSTQKTPKEEKTVHAKWFLGEVCWLAFEYDPEREEFFGWVDLGPGFYPELGYFTADDILHARGSITVVSGKRPVTVAGIRPAERDTHFTPRPLAQVDRYVQAERPTL